MKMLKNLPLVIEKAGTHLPAIAFVVGVVFIFLGFFELRDLKPVGVDAKWGPIVVGGLFAAIGLALYLLHLLRPPRPERDSHSLPSDSLPSAGLVYVLRHLDVRGGEYGFPWIYAYQLYVFNTKSPSDDEFKATRAGWSKASDYAVRYLALMGFAEKVDLGNEYRITAKGRAVLQSDSLRSKYIDAFARKIVSEKD